MFVICDEQRPTRVSLSLESMRMSKWVFLNGGAWARAPLGWLKAVIETPFHLLKAFFITSKCVNHLSKLVVSAADAKATEKKEINKIVEKFSFEDFNGRNVERGGDIIHFHETHSCISTWYIEKWKNCHCFLRPPLSFTSQSRT